MNRWQCGLKRCVKRIAIPSITIAAAAVTWFASPPAGAQSRAAKEGEWPNFSGDVYGTKYSPLAQITKENVKDLQVAWRWTPPDRQIQDADPTNLQLRISRNEDSPLVVNGVLYTVSPLGIVAALDPGSGQERWVYDPKAYENGKPATLGFIHRGLAYWTDGRAERILHATNNAYLDSIDAKTGKLDPTFGRNGRVDLTEGIRDAIRATNWSGRRPTVAGDVVIVGSAVMDQNRNKEMPPGYVKAFDVKTGKLRWIFQTIPRPGEVGNETWENDSWAYSGNANVYSGISYDPELDYVYLSGSSATSDFYGGHRLGDNLFAETIICVEAKTGKRVWHYQVAHHGLWDYDLAPQPILGDVTVGGRRIKALIQVTKQAFTFVLDRKTGQAVWPIEERPVPQSNVPGERTSPTQPFPTKPPPFDLQGTTENNLIDFTPALKKRALDVLHQYSFGPLYAPPTAEGNGMLALPGNVGGANWAGAAFDPETGILYVPSQMSPSRLRISAADPKQTNLRYRNGGEPGLRPPPIDIEGLSIFKPPYSRLTAIDMNKGEHLWMKPLGDGPRNHPLLKDLKLGPLGDRVDRVTVLLTKTLVFVGVMRNGPNGLLTPVSWAKYADPDMDKKLIFVFDKKSGELIREIKLDGFSVAGPMSYMHQGKQHIAVSVGGATFPELVAFKLP